MARKEKDEEPKASGSDDNNEEEKDASPPSPKRDPPAKNAKPKRAVAAAATEPGAVSSNTATPSITNKVRTVPPASKPGAQAMEPGAPQTSARVAAERTKASAAPLEPTGTVTTKKKKSQASGKKVSRKANGAAKEPGAVTGREGSAGGGQKAAVQAAVEAERNIRNKIQVHDTSSQQKPEGAVEDKPNGASRGSSKDADAKNGADMVDGDVDVEKGDKEENPTTTEVNHGMVQNPAYESRTVGKMKEDLPSAVPVDDHGTKIHSAEVIDEQTTPMQKRPIFWIFVVALVLLLGLAVGLPVGLMNRDDDNDSEDVDMSPTQSPTSQEKIIFKAALAEKAGPDLIAYSTKAFDLAVDWFYDDPLRYTNIKYIGVNETTGEPFLEESEEENLNMQRFALVWLWFHSTLGGEEKWITCNPPVEGETDDCDFLAVSGTEPLGEDVVICYTDLPFKRWLSRSAHECEWPGVLCDRSFSNSIAFQLELLAFGMKGTFPVFLQLMPAIRSIQITYGAVSGQFPDGMDNFKTLKQMTVIGNLLSDPIPDSFFKMPLWVLNLAYNRFQGALPESIGDFPEIGAIYLMNNRFQGPLPSGLSKASSLVFLSLEGNAFVDAELPDSWGKLTDLESLIMYESGLKGTIPQSWSNLTKMQNFRLRDNNLEGPLPKMEWPLLQRIFMQNNQFTGTFPEEF